MTVFLMDNLFENVKKKKKIQIGLPLETELEGRWF